MNAFLLLIFFSLFKFGEGPAAFSGKDPYPEELTEQTSRKDYVYWQKDHPLKWEYFKGRTDATDVVHGAVTYAGIHLRTEKHPHRSGRLTFKAVAVFDKNLSWVKPDCKEAGLLAHEQLHFDITELFSRRLERKLNALKLSSRDKKKIRQLQQQYSREQLEVQKRYDEETLHGIREEKQKAWRTIIDRQLKNPSELSSLVAQKQGFRNP